MFQFMKNFMEFNKNKTKKCVVLTHKRKMFSCKFLVELKHLKNNCELKGSNFLQKVKLKKLKVYKNQ